MKSKLKNLVVLSQNVKIYVPSTVNIDQEIDSSEFVKETLCFLASLFNGSTSYNAFGAWIAQDGKLIKEKVTICESFCNEKQLNESIDIIYDYCLNLKINLNQEAISLEINNKLYFI